VEYLGTRLEDAITLRDRYVIEFAGPVIDAMSRPRSQTANARRERHLERALQYPAPPALTAEVPALIEGAWERARTFVNTNRGRIEALAEHVARQPGHRLSGEGVRAYPAVPQHTGTTRRARR
jgi:hypothetical protein